MLIVLGFVKDINVASISSLLYDLAKCIGVAAIWGCGKGYWSGLFPLWWLLILQHTVDSLKCNITID